MDDPTRYRFVFEQEKTPTYKTPEQNSKELQELRDQLKQEIVASLPGRVTRLLPSCESYDDYKRFIDTKFGEENGWGNQLEVEIDDITLYSVTYHRPDLDTAQVPQESQQDRDRRFEYHKTLLAYASLEFYGEMAARPLCELYDELLPIGFQASELTRDDLEKYLQERWLAHQDRTVVCEINF